LTARGERAQAIAPRVKDAGGMEMGPDPEGRARAAPSEFGNRGGAFRARARSLPDDVRIRQAFTASLVRLRALGPTRGFSGLPEPRSLDEGAAEAFPRGFRHEASARDCGACAACRSEATSTRHMHQRGRPPPQARFSAPARSAEAKGRNAEPVAGCALIFHEKFRHADGATLVPASPGARRTLRQDPGAFLPPEPKRSRSIRQRERTQCGTDGESGDKVWRFLG
jgi:hypothetical protein